MSYDIKSAIPHREPFLLVDEIIEVDGVSVKAATTLRPDDELWSKVYAGHYPGSPLTPGVLLLEMLFQAAGVMIAEKLKENAATGVPVVTRIQNVKFKNMVLPGDRVELNAKLTDSLANAYYAKGDIKSNGKTVLQAEFTLALVDK